ncbi:MAG TPA: YceI family protein [Chloroflexota bacterium]
MSFSKIWPSLALGATLLASVACGGAPAATPTAGPSAVPTAAATPAAAPASGTSVRIAFLPDASEASFRVKEQLAGRQLPTDAVGKTKAVTGTLVIGSDGRLLGEQSKVMVDMNSLQSDESRRDNFIKRNVLQTERFPQAEFVPRQIEGLAQPLPTDGATRFKLSGDLTVRGVTTPVTWDVTAQASGQEVNGTATTRVTFEQFGLTPPRVGPVLSVENELRLQLDFKATRATV